MAFFRTASTGCAPRPSSPSLSRREAAPPLTPSHGCSEDLKRNGTGGSGGSGTSVADGGEAGLASGGTSPNAGGGAGAGQAGGSGGIETTVLPYPLNPTVPLSADCSCADDASVCNAASECVPRCEPGGVCAVWRVDRDVSSMLTIDDAIYFILAAGRDDLFQALPGEDGHESLWKVHYPEPTPTKLAVLGGEGSRFLAHVSDTIYLVTSRPSTTSDSAVSVLRAVKNDGGIIERDLPSDVGNISMSPDGLFSVVGDGSISRLAFGPDGSLGTEFESIVPGSGRSDRVEVLAADRLWRRFANTLCSFDLANLQAAAHCIEAEFTSLFGATGSRAVVRNPVGEGVDEIDVDAQVKRSLLHPEQFRSFFGTMGGGFVTGWLLDIKDPGASLLARFPTEGIAKEPASLIGQEVVRALVETQTLGGDDGFASPAVTSDAVYWTRWFADSHGRPGHARYVFRAPLPR